MLSSLKKYRVEINVGNTNQKKSSNGQGSGRSKGNRDRKVKTKNIIGKEPVLGMDATEWSLLSGVQ